MEIYYTVRRTGTEYIAVEHLNKSERSFYKKVIYI